MAVKDYSADKRQEYNRAIAAKEHELEELRAEEKSLVETLESTEESLRQNIAQVSESNQKLIAKGSLVAQNALDSDQAVSSFARGLAERQREEIPQMFAGLRQKTEDDIESLQRKRDSLPWDAPKKDTKE